MSKPPENTLPHAPPTSPRVRSLLIIHAARLDAYLTDKRVRPFDGSPGLPHVLIELWTVLAALFG